MNTQNPLGKRRETEECLLRQIAATEKEMSVLECRLQELNDKLARLQYIPAKKFVGGYYYFPKTKNGRTK
jgi:hypothetical protein